MEMNKDVPYTASPPYAPSAGYANPGVFVVQPVGMQQVSLQQQGPRGPTGGPMGQWSDGCCDCCTECGSCWMALCCTCCPLGQLAEKVGCCAPNAFWKVMLSAVFLVLVAYAASFLGVPNVSGILLFFFIFFVRAKVMQAYQIPYNCCENFWCSLCCGCCMVSQMMRHVFGFPKAGCTGCVCSPVPPDYWPSSQQV